MPSCPNCGSILSKDSKVVGFLRELAEHESLSFDDLVRDHGYSKTYLSLTSQALELGGLLTRNRIGRRIHFAVTDRGRELVGAVAPDGGANGPRE